MLIVAFKDLLQGETFRHEPATQLLAKGRHFLRWRGHGISVPEVDCYASAIFAKQKAIAAQRENHLRFKFRLKEAVMEANVILLVDADADTCAATLAAARSAKLDVRYAQVTRNLSEITEYGLDDIALIVLDFDPDARGAAISETLREWSPPRPIILVSSVDAQQSMMLLQGAAKYLSKTVSIERLTKAIEALAHPSQVDPSDCDRWGHWIEDRESACQKAAAGKLAAEKC